MTTKSLGDMGDLSALLNEAPKEGGFLEIDLDLIQEDPDQPRKSDNPGFSQISIAELAATIRERGVKSPISVRINEDGVYIINHGARRYRASKVAGKTTIPAFIDQDYNEADQVIENLQRNELTAREIADFIGRELAKGVKKGVIAKSIGKSPAFVTQHVTLLELPDVIADAFTSGRASDVTAINELVSLFKKYPDDVELWLADETQEVSRASVKLFKEFIELKASKDAESEEDSVGEASESLGDDSSANASAASGFEEEEQGGSSSVDSSTASDFEEEEKEEQSSGVTGIDALDNQEEESEWEDQSGGESEPAADFKEEDLSVLKKPAVRVLYDGRLAILNIKKNPTAGHAWLKNEDDGHEFEADVNHIKIVSVGEL
jgi:ParB family chromosome partitioning protein